MAVFKPFVTKNGIDINTFRLTNLADPVANTDAVNKNYSANASNITAGILGLNYGGTGASTADAAINNLVPLQVNKEGQVLSTNGLSVSWKETFSGNYEDLTNKPTFASVAYTGMLGDLGNVDLSTAPQDGQVLAYDGATSKWKPIVPPNALDTLAVLKDVDVTTAQEGSVLAYNSTTEKWESTNQLLNITLDAGTYGGT